MIDIKDLHDHLVNNFYTHAVNNGGDSNYHPGIYVVSPQDHGNTELVYIKAAGSDVYYFEYYLKELICVRQLKIILLVRI